MAKSITTIATPYRNQRLEEEMTQNPTSTNNPAEAEQTVTTEGNGEATSGDADEGTYFHRWKNLKKHHDTEIHSARQRIKELEEKINSSKKITPPKTKEELESFRQNNPDLYDTVLSVAQLQTSAITSKELERLKHLEDKLAEAEADKALATVQNKHPDVIQILESMDFDQWLNQQDASVQAMVNDNTSNANALIRALDLFKFDTGMSSGSAMQSSKTKAPVPSQKSAADAVNIGGSHGMLSGDDGKRIWTKEEIRRMRSEEFEAMEAEIMEAYAEGRVR